MRRARSRRQREWPAAWMAVALALALGAGCAGMEARRSGEVVPLRASEVLEYGDHARRASMRYVIEGLDADEEGDPRRARGDYERALQVDPTNPFAYLAMARHHAELGDVQDALAYLDQAEALFVATSSHEDGLSPRVRANLLGLRGQTLYESGSIEEGRALLERAWEMAPAVWGDGRLTAAELR